MRTRCSDVVRSKVSKQTKTCEIFIHKHMITNKQLDVSISSAAEQRFLLILILQKRQPTFLSLHLDMVGIELHYNIPLQGPKCYIPLELLFFRCRFFLPVESELQKSLIRLINHGTKLLELFLSSCSKFQRILSNVAFNQILLLQKNQGTYSNIFYGLEAYGTH